jgi:hypothetical protein
MFLKCSQISSFLLIRNEWETLLVETQTEHSRLGGRSFLSFAGALTAFLTGVFGFTMAPASTCVMVGHKDWRARSKARPARVCRAAALARVMVAPVDLRPVCIVRAILRVTGGGVSSSSSIGLARDPTRVISLYSTRRSG